MKKLLLALLLFTGTLVHGQGGYPRVETDSTGQVYVIMTLEQAQKLDNAADLLAAFEVAGASTAEADEACIKVVTEQGVLIASLGGEIAELNTLCAVLKGQIDLLSANALDYVAKEKTWEAGTANLQKISEEYRIEARKSKTRSIIGGSSSGLIIIGLLTALILK